MLTDQHSRAVPEGQIRLARGAAGGNVVRTSMSRFLRRCAMGLAFAVSVGAGTAAHGATVSYLSDAELARRAPRIVHGRVEKRWTEVDGRGLVRTVARIAVEEDLTGVDASWVDVEQLGGAAGGRVLVVPGESPLEPGRDVLVCLEPARREGRWRLMALGASMFQVDDHGPDAPEAGRARLRRRDAGLNVLGRPASPGQAPTLDEFRRMVRRTRGVRPVRPVRRGGGPQPAGAPSAPLGEGPVVSASFTLLGGGVRWNEVDAGASIRWYRNVSAPAPVDGTDGEAEIRTALSAWSTAPGAAIPLVYGGPRNVGADSVWCGPSNAGAGLITFEDPTGELGSGVIALGGGCTSVIGRTTVNGTLFDSFTHGFVILNRSAEVGPAYRTPLNFARIIQHEVGHGIGLGHTPTGVVGAQANIMYPSCCYASTPVPPALGADDLAGVRFVYPTPVATGDGDGDGLADAWETLWGLDPRSAAGGDGAGGDPDGDGRTNLQEFQEGGHPRGFHRYWFAEGARGPFFVPELGVVVPGAAPATLRLRTYADPPLHACDLRLRLEPRRPVLVAPDRCLDDSQAWTPAAMASLLESDEPLVAERVMSWPRDPSGGAMPGQPVRARREAYGAHAETAIETPARTWHFAEGATHSGFDLFFLVFNTEERPVTVTARYLRPAPLPPVVRRYVVEPRARRTIWVNLEEPDLASTDVAASFAADGAVVVERSMYLSSPALTFLAGHNASGATAPSTRWWFAEGATGPLFDTFLLVANPTAEDAALTVRYFLADGTLVERPVAAPAGSRVSVWVDAEDSRLEDATFGLELRSDNGVPVVAERAMWWPGPGIDRWVEAHVSGGAPAPALHWVTSDAEVGGERAARTYLLVLNPDPDPADIEVTALFEDGSQVTAGIRAAGRARTTIDLGAVLPATTDRRFAVEVRVPGAGASQGVVVERATYWDSERGPWAAGVAVRATAR